MIVLESIAVADVVLAVASAAIMLAGSLAFYALRKAWPDYQAQNERLRTSSTPSVHSFWGAVARKIDRMPVTTPSGQKPRDRAAEHPRQHDAES